MSAGDTSLVYKGQRVDVPALMRYIANHEVSARYSPWFFSYYGDLTGEAYLARYLRFMRGLLSFLPHGVAGLTALDAGCGFGIMSTLLGLMGAGEVHGLDAHRGMIATFSTYLPILPYRLPVYPQLGDVSAMPYASESFDVVISHEAISHYLHVDGFLAEAYRVLRTGGTLIISDSNNALNPRVVRRTYEVWQAFERGPARQNVHGHKVEVPFMEQRAAIIAGDWPALAPQEVSLLAEHTSGLWGAGLRTAVEDYVRTGRVPDHVYRRGTCPVDPVQGYYIESLLDPRDLRRRLEGLGFEARVIAYLGGARGGLLALANALLTWRPLTPLVLPLARGFRIVATKSMAGAPRAAPDLVGGA
jgi:2-polyprenyl-3-methyl-5-hydroxy-6-metoxy-1,4-benzoquinol methylase